MSRFREVIDEAVPEADRGEVGSLAVYIMNTTPGYRPSDAASYAVRIYQEGGMAEWNERRVREREDIHRRECQFRVCQRCADIDARR
jgi:hypothetical protein